LLTDFVCLYNYEFWLSLCKIVRSSVILLLPLYTIVWDVQCFFFINIIPLYEMCNGFFFVNIIPLYEMCNVFSSSILYHCMSCALLFSSSILYHCMRCALLFLHQYYTIVLVSVIAYLCERCIVCKYVERTFVSWHKLCPIQSLYRLQ
jgi:hypothetical protein